MGQPFRKVKLNEETALVMRAFTQMAIDMKLPLINQVVGDKYIMKIKNFARLELRTIK